MSKLIYAGLSITNVLWAFSLLLDPNQYLGKPIVPPLFAIIHIAIALMIILPRTRIYAGWISMAVLSYYWFLVKPREPIAEPQSVGILAISATLVFPHVQILLKRKVSEAWSLLAVRLGLAYPFLEWGLDALRNPGHFHYYLVEENPLTRPVMQSLNPGSFILLLGLFEITLALLLTVGFGSRANSLVALLALIIFSIVTSYPLALPQDIALGAGALYGMNHGASVFSVDHALTKMFHLSS